MNSRHEVGDFEETIIYQYVLLGMRIINCRVSVNTRRSIMNNHMAQYSFGRRDAQLRHRGPRVLPPRPQYYRQQIVLKRTNQEKDPGVVWDCSLHFGRKEKKIAIRKLSRSWESYGGHMRTYSCWQLDAPAWWDSTWRMRPWSATPSSKVTSILWKIDVQRRATKQIADLLTRGASIETTQVKIPQAQWRYDWNVPVHYQGGPEQDH